MENNNNYGYNRPVRPNPNNGVRRPNHNSTVNNANNANVNRNNQAMNRNNTNRQVNRPVRPNPQNSSSTVRNTRPNPNQVNTRPNMQQARPRTNNNINNNRGLQRDTGNQYNSNVNVNTPNLQKPQSYNDYTNRYNSYDDYDSYDNTAVDIGVTDFSDDFDTDNEYGYNSNKNDPIEIHYDEYGNTVDQYGNPIEIDEYGNPVRLDEYGNPIQTDEYGDNQYNDTQDNNAYNEYNNPNLSNPNMTNDTYQDNRESRNDRNSYNTNANEEVAAKNNPLLSIIGLGLGIISLLMAGYQIASNIMTYINSRKYEDMLYIGMPIMTIVLSVCTLVCGIIVSATNNKSRAKRTIIKLSIISLLLSFALTINYMHLLTYFE